MPAKTLVRNTIVSLSPEALARVAANNIGLADDEQIAHGNFSVIVYNDDCHSDIWAMQMLRNIFNADTKKTATVALSIHTNGSATLFTGSRENCRKLMRQIAMHGGCMATNLVLGIDNRNSLATEIVRNSDGAIVQRSRDVDERAIVPLD